MSASIKVTIVPAMVGLLICAEQRELNACRLDARVAPPEGGLGPYDKARDRLAEAEPVVRCHRGDLQTGRHVVDAPTPS